VAGGGQRARDRRFLRSHPALELALLILGLKEAGLGLEDVFLTGGLEVVRHRFLQGRFVFLDHPAHAIELLDAPCVRARNAAGEIGLLGVKDFLKLIH